ALDDLLEIRLGPGARLHERDATRCVWQEHVEEPRSPTGRLGREPVDLRGDVRDQVAPRVDLELRRRHGPVTAPRSPSRARSAPVPGRASGDARRTPDSVDPPPRRRPTTPVPWRPPTRRATAPPARPAPRSRRRRRAPATGGRRCALAS